MKNDRSFKVWMNELEIESKGKVSNFPFEKVVYLYTLGFGPRFSWACLCERQG